MIQAKLNSSSTLRLDESCASEALKIRGFQNLEAHASTINLESNEVLLVIGEEGDRFYVVQEGSILAEDSKGHVMHEFRSKEGFGERWLLFQHEPAGATCRAGPQGAVLKAISRPAFQQEFAHCFINAGNYRGRVVRAKTTKKTRFLERDICEFRGIRFATRNLRYDLPQLLDAPQTQTIDAFEYGPDCVQIGGEIFDQMVPKVPPRSKPSLLQFLHNKQVSPPDEDCLCLNVCAPLGANGSVAPTAKYPVMVWVHGGAFVTGAGSLPMYEGRELSSKGAVIVTINYRLGALGFLNGLSDVPLNLGLHDQVAALRWVKKNIHLFGGDSNNVTVFGESAGGSSVTSLLGMKVRRDEKLFQKAIAQSSASATAIMTQSQAIEMTQAFSASLLDHLKLPKGTVITKEILDTCPIQAIKAATESTARTTLRSKSLKGVAMPFQPCCWENGPLSHDLLFQCVSPYVNVARGIADDVTLLIGMNANEYSLFMLDNAWRRTVAKAKGSKKAFKSILQQRLVDWAHEDRRYGPVSNLEQRTASIVEFYMPSGGNDQLNEDEAGALFEKLHTAWLFELGADRFAFAKQADGGGNPVYTYRLHFMGPMNQLGSPHAIDLPLVFGSFKTDPIAALLSGDGPEAIECSQEMMKAWIAFAKTGNPGWAPMKPKIFGAGDPKGLAPPPGLFSTDKERAVWSDFLYCVELDTPFCVSRTATAKL